MQLNEAPALGGNSGYERTYSPYNTPQNLAISGTYVLPVGRGKKYMGNSSRFVDTVLGGWQIQTIIILRSGAPYTPIVSTDRANTGVGSQRPNINPAGGSPSFKRTLSHWFDQTAYMDAPQFTYGQVRANTLRSDAFRQFDASIFKNFVVTSESTLSFRAEFFNISNTTSFNPPNAAYGASPPYNATIDSPAGATIIGTSIPSRDIQFALKYNF
jgi:hypothetical protein